MKRTLRLLSLLAATLLLLAACSTAEEAGETTDSSTESLEEVVEEESPPSGSVEEPSEPVADTGDDTAGSDQTIAALASETPELSQLTSVLETAGLTSVLEEAGPLTVFAPNNDAFAELDLAELAADPAQLTDILQYHVVEGAVTSDQLEDGQTVTTLQGGELTVSIDGETVMVGDATVVQADIQAGNGVIHVIDTVPQP
jgi:uncharacterized surface protein with fasciclin (FAS1) repeats